MAQLHAVRPSGAVSSRDRTSEFLAVVQRLQSSKGASTTSGPSEPATHAQHSAFSKQAAAIGQGIHSTSQKLAKLAVLAKRTSLFDDPAQEIQELSAVVKVDIQSLNDAITSLATLSTSAKAAPNRQAADHSHTVVDSLRTRLKDTTKELKDVLTLRTDSLKVHADRRNLFGSGAGPRFQRPGAGADFLPTRPRNPQLLHHRKGGDGGGERDGEGVNGQQQSALVPAPTVAQQQVMVVPQDTYLDSRATALRQVEGTIQELGGIFQQLAHMVAEQGEVAIRIDENVGDTLSNVEAGQAQLLKYYDTISSNRWLILKVFGVLMLFLAFFVAFIA